MKAAVQKNFYQEFADFSDEEVVAFAQCGNDLAKEYILHKYRSNIYLKTRHYFLQGAERDDLMQEGLIGLFKAIGDYCPAKEVPFRIFADLCVTRQIITAIKTSTRQKHLPLNLAYPLDKPVYENGSDYTMIDTIADQQCINPEEVVLSHERYDTLKDGLRKHLSKFEFQVLLLFLEKLSYQEIANYLQTSVKSVDNALTRIKNKIAKRIKYEIIE